MRHTAIGVILIVCLTVFAGCSGSSGGGGSPSYYIASEAQKGDTSLGTAPSDVDCSVVFASSMDVFSDSIGADAIVDINALTLTPVQIFIWLHNSNSEPAINVSDSVDLNIDYLGTVITSTVTMPEKPVVTAPTGGSSVDAGSPVTVTWDAFTVDPDFVNVLVEWMDTQSDEDYEVQLAGNALTHDIPANILKTGDGSVDIQVQAFNLSTTFTGPVRAGSIHSASHVTIVNISTN